MRWSMSTTVSPEPLWGLVLEEIWWLQTCPPKSSIVLPQWQSSFAGSTFTSPASLFLPTHQPGCSWACSLSLSRLTSLLLVSFIHSRTGTAKSFHNSGSQRAFRAADRKSWIMTSGWPTGSRQIRHTHTHTPPDLDMSQKAPADLPQQLFCHDGSSDTGHHVVFD